MPFVSQDLKKVTADLKPIYNAATEEAALVELDRFEEIWGSKYPLFMVLEGELFIDLEDKTISLKPGEIFTIPCNVMHRTRSNKRTVNLCFEKAVNDINR